MGRHHRMEGKTSSYFIGAEGRNNQEIFKNELEEEFFLSLFQKQIIKSKLTVYAYVLLPNLYACLLEPRIKTSLLCMK